MMINLMIALFTMTNMMNYHDYPWLILVNSHISLTWNLRPAMETIPFANPDSSEVTVRSL
jgi:hypothetical protein